MTIIIGIDPGSRLTGYGIINDHKGVQCAIDFGVIRTKGDALSQRLYSIHQQLLSLSQQHDFDVLAIESVFFAKNAQSALKLGQARGAAIAALAHNDLPCIEYSPRQVKQSVVGFGGATKVQMQHMVRSLLKLQQTPPPDAADALAIALCHCHQQRLTHTLKRSQITAGDGA